MSGLLLAIAGALHPVTSGPKAPVQIILTSGTSWTVPADWNSANNKIECIGAGRGGGGAYARKNNLALTAGANVAYQIGTYSSTQSVADTWFGSTSTVKATGSVGASGGAAASCIGDVRYSGGNGATSGGGAAGPNGDGGAGATGGGAVGGAGDAGFGGAGGSSGNPGQPGTEWGAAGSGGGGGSGGSGGLYGGGGGGGGGGGAPGLIVITYTPA